MTTKAIVPQTKQYIENKGVNKMDDFLQDIVDCFNMNTPKHIKADTAEEVLEKLDKAFKAGNVDQPLKFD